MPRLTSRSFPGWISRGRIRSLKVVVNQLQWEAVDSWITPNEQFFGITHYEWPEIDVANWTLEITGMVQNPMTLTLDDIKAWPRQELPFTIECSGNHGFEWFTGGIGNAVWAGTALAPILDEAGVLDDGIEVAFFGTDVGEEVVREQTIMQNFARSMSLEDAMSPYNLLAYEMNGEPLPAAQRVPSAPDRTGLVWHRQCQMAQAH